MEHAGVLAAVGVMKPRFDLAVRASTMGGSAATVLAALVGDSDVALTVADAWKLSRKERETLMHVARSVETACNLSLMDWKKRAVLDGKELALEALCLTDKLDWKDTLTEWEMPVFPLTGADVLSLGVEPGPEVGRRMRACKALWLDSDFELDARKLYQLAASV
jgi:tRNA nucleotidyltransferase/poly(A) polymerase